MPQTCRVAIALAVIFTGACSKDAAEVTKDYRPKLEARLEQIKTMVNGHPSLEKAPVDKLRFHYSSRPNALLVQASWLDGGADDDNLMGTESQPVGVVQQALLGQPDGAASYYEDNYKIFLGAKYLVLVRNSISPVIVSGDSFTAGGAKGSLEIYDIPSGKKVDELSFEVSPSGSVTVAAGKAHEGVVAELKRRLWHKANAAITPYLDAGEKPPF